MNVKRNNLKVVILIATLVSCQWRQTPETVYVTIDQKQSGWYFLVIVADSTKKATDVIKTRFKGSRRMAMVKVKSFNQTVVSPYDDAGNDLSDELRLPGVSNPQKNVHVFRFYNPTRQELNRVQHWTPKSSIADSIILLERFEYNRYVKNMISHL
jgi:hypothetical protein